MFLFIGNITFRKSFGGSVSPEQPWLAPETFACLETFGPANKEDLPYEIFGMGANENGFDRVSYGTKRNERFSLNIQIFIITASFGNLL